MLASSLWTQNRRQLHQSIAEMCEADGNLEQAVEHYQRAGDLFKGDVRPNLAPQNTTYDAA